MDGAMHRDSEGSNGKDGVKHRETIDEQPTRAGESSTAQRSEDVGDENDREARAGRRWWKRGQRETYSQSHFKVYKRRWFGLAQLVLLNVVVSWDVCHCCWLALHDARRCDAMRKANTL